MAEPTPSVSLSRIQNMMNTQPDGMEATKLCIYKSDKNDPEWMHTLDMRGSNDQ